MDVFFSEIEIFFTTTPPPPPPNISFVIIHNFGLLALSVEPGFTGLKEIQLIIEASSNSPGQNIN